MEQMGVSCTPQCGSCRCGKCPTGGKDYTIKEEHELRLIEEGLVHKGNYWLAHYPWHKEPMLLPNNRSIAYKMLQSTERNLSKDPARAEIYKKLINDMVERRVARKLTDAEILNYKGPVYYLPYHIVTKQDSKSTPWRLVFNPSAKMFGHVINDYWAKGPNLLSNLLGIVIRFREEVCALIGDIRKMFHAIKISELDQHTHRFLWRDMKLEQDPEEYIMLSVSFGDKPAGGIAIVALRKTAQLSRDQHLDAAQVLINNVYMDDIIDSFSTYSQTLKVSRDIDRILQLGNFEVKGWILYNGEEDKMNKDDESNFKMNKDDESNFKMNKDDESKYEMNKVDKGNYKMNKDDESNFKMNKDDESNFKKKIDDKSYHKMNIDDESNHKKNRDNKSMNEMDGSDESMHKVLGLSWDSKTDCFKYFQDQETIARYMAQCTNALLTKRNILSMVNGIYDPLGLISPVIIKAKILLKKLWMYEIGWDDPVPKEIACDWIEFCFNIPMVKELSFSRCMKTLDTIDDPIMITFCDASELAFGTCTYLRWLTTNGSYHTQLVASKGRVSPSKVQSIVRLEICGAVLGKRLAQFIESETRYKIRRRYFIVDSEVVRSMIQKQSYGYNTFVATRIGEIQEYTDPSEWFWVESNANIADWITRGKDGDEISEHSKWQRGPSFLREEENKWPVKGSEIEDVPELKSSNFIHLLAETTSRLSNLIDIERFGNYMKLLRSTARVIAVFNERCSFENLLMDPSWKDITTAQNMWIKDVQRSMISDIAKGKFQRLNPSVNDEGIYIVSGRMEYWFEYTYNDKGLILLPYKNRFSFLYASFIHNISHSGVAATVAKVRRRFWIVNLSKLVKGIRVKCVTCRKLDKEVQNQIMAPLPIERLKPSPPFHYTSLDLFGPLEVRGEVNKRSKGKVFGVIFTCLSTRAIYCDLAQDYSTDAFLLVLRRFVSIHGYPAKIYSDPGTQLVSADKQLKKMAKEIEKRKGYGFGVNHGVEWYFSSPDAPWQNGTAESLIKSVKRAMIISIGQQILRFSELQTVLFEVANLVNERPIGVHPKDPQDGKYLCPNDLLLGRSSSSVPSGPFKECSNVRRLAFVESLVDAFWKKWMQNYFSSLILRPKWHTSKRNLQINDIVLIQDSNVLRGVWRLGRVSNIDPSNDGIVRKVEVQYKSNLESKGFETIRRPVQRLVLIQPVDEPSDNKI